MSDYLSVSEVAARLGLDRTTVSKWCQSGQVSCYRINRKGRKTDKYLFSRSQYNSLLVEHGPRQGTPQLNTGKGDASNGQA